jgi:hypothetical protein
MVGIKKRDISTFDGIFSILGFILGLSATFLNLIYTSTLLFLLGPVIAITSLYYLKNRTSLLSADMPTKIVFDRRYLIYINILFWSFFSLSLISYYTSSIYHRQSIFFILISICITLIGIEIFLIDNNKRSSYNIILKILLISIFVRASAYFVSPYPIGSDSWIHFEYAKEFLVYNNLQVTPGMTAINQYYVNYPLTHLFAMFCYLLLNISLTKSFFIVGLVFTLSTVFVYLLSVKLTKNIQISLLALLFVNFAGYHMQWGIEILAMSYGVAIYSIIIYLLFTKDIKNNVSYTAIIIFLLFVMVYTHTISTFILLISFLVLFITDLLISNTNYFAIFVECNRNKIISSSFILILGAIMFINWTSESYSFFDSIFVGLLNSLSHEASLVEGTSTSNLNGNTLESLYILLGNLVYISLGILGTLVCLSNKYLNKKSFCLISMIGVLYLFRYAFPLFGIRNIIPDRWPVFILITFSIFISIGLVKLISNIQNNNKKIVFLFLFFVITIFLMITSGYANKDSPIYGGDTIQRFVWTESEMSLFTNINYLYDGIIVADQQTARRPFEGYLRRNYKDIMFYQLSNDGNIDYNQMDGNVIIWRKTSLYRPVTAGYQSARTNLILGNKFYNEIENKYCSIYDVGEAKAYV